MKVTDLESTAHFPEEMEALRKVMGGVAGYNSLRQQLTADMADSSQRCDVKSACQCVCAVHSPTVTRVRKSVQQSVLLTFVTSREARQEQGC